MSIHLGRLTQWGGSTVFLSLVLVKKRKSRKEKQTNFIKQSGDPGSGRKKETHFVKVV